LFSYNTVICTWHFQTVVIVRQYDQNCTQLIYSECWQQAATSSHQNIYIKKIISKRMPANKITAQNEIHKITSQNFIQ